MSESEENPMRFANTARRLAFAALVLAAACSSDQPSTKRSSGSGGTSGSGSGGGTTSGGGGGASGTSSTGTGGSGIDTGGRDASVVDASSCFTCNPPGGQYCGVIGEGCS